MLNASELLMELLLEQGVDLVFGYPGGAVLHIYDALYKYSGRIRHVITAHEQGAAHAADGYARVTGKPGVVMATSGPGATNLVTGIAAAYMDSVPMVAITGNVGTGLIGRDSFQEVYIAGITLPITKHNFVVRHAGELAPTIRAAFRIAQEGRKGPVLVDIPRDVSAAACEYVPIDTPRRCAPPPPEEGGLARVAEALNNAKQPLVFFGGGVQAANAGEALRALCEKGDIPAAHTLMAAGVLRWDEPYNLGLAGMHGNASANQAIARADVLLIAGSRLSDRIAPGFARFAPKAFKIHVDIDPAELGKNVPADLALEGDAGICLERLLPLAEEKTRPEWRAEIARWRAEDDQPQDGGGAPKPHQIMRAIGELAGEETIYVTDVGQHQLWAAQYARHARPRSFLTSGGLGAMGYGYGAAIGAAFAANGRPVAHITGDGSFHMNLNEACTAVNCNLPVISVICNNRALGLVRQWQDISFGRRHSATEPERYTDYVKLAEGFGLQGYRCNDIGQFKEAFARALALKAPAWIECPIDREEKVRHGF
ncbi:MAG: biosynthetic-type acetolactate synthase large subunit [Oscillospiraceae bacterium]|jgi:acetolactate synthase-1/2/3 large subunit|nr:biosynthetic-type acetolactate synthase large subunit [Oscillospiraceae bacterium]